MRNKIPFREHPEFNLHRENPDAVIKAFRIHRLKQIRSISENFKSESTLVIHIISPDCYFSEDYQPIDSFMEDAETLKLMNDVSGNSNRRNFEGYCIRDFEGEDNLKSYVQISRNGWVEAVDTSILTKPLEKRKANMREKLSTFLSSYLNFLVNNEITGNLFVLITMLNVCGTQIRYGEEGKENLYSIDRDVLVFPMFAIDLNNTNLDSSLEPFYEQLAYSSGWSEY